MANPTALMETSLGNIKIELFTDKMPITAKNFVDLAKSGFYDGFKAVNGQSPDQSGRRWPLPLGLTSTRSWKG